MREWTEQHIKELIDITMEEHGITPGEGGGNMNAWDDGLVDFYKYTGTANRLALLQSTFNEEQFDLLSVRWSNINEPHGPFGGPQSERRKILLTMQRQGYDSLPALTVMGKVVIPDIRTSFGLQRASGKPVEPVEWLQNNRITPNPTDLAGAWNTESGVVTFSILPSTYTRNGYTFPCYDIVNNSAIEIMSWNTATKEVLI